MSEEHAKNKVTEAEMHSYFGDEGIPMSAVPYIMNPGNVTTEEFRAEVKRLGAEHQRDREEGREARINALIAHYVGSNMLMDQLEIEPTPKELEQVLDTLSRHSGSAFDDRAQAIIFIARLISTNTIEKNRLKEALSNSLDLIDELYRKYDCKLDADDKTVAQASRETWLSIK